MLPEPTITLSIPSINNGTLLDCRIYHPLSLAANPEAPTWLKHAAVVAHPYAPMGGCYDDPVVGAVAAQLLRKGFLVATFNFRYVSHHCNNCSRLTCVGALMDRRDGLHGLRNPNETITRPLWRLFYITSITSTPSNHI